MNMTSRRTLSSSKTFLLKFIFPTLWIGGFGAGVSTLWFGEFMGSVSAHDPELKWIFIFVWLAGSAFIWTPGHTRRLSTFHFEGYFSISRLTFPLQDLVLRFNTSVLLAITFRWVTGAVRTSGATHAMPLERAGPLPRARGP